MILIIDNYDSFVYNLAQYIGELGWEPEVFRNDEIKLEEIERLAPSHIVISPGPCTPLEAGISNDVVRHFSGKVPILGVCLGHQCMGHTFGGAIVRTTPMHGKTSVIHHDGRGIFNGLPNPLEAGRYHSLIIERESLSSCLEITAWIDTGVIMGVRHREYVVEGIQFHPESVLTPTGHDLLRNFPLSKHGEVQQPTQLEHGPERVRGVQAKLPCSFYLLSLTNLQPAKNDSKLVEADPADAPSERPDTRCGLTRQSEDNLCGRATGLASPPLTSA